MIDGKDADLLGSAADEIRDDFAEVDLAEARRSEPGAGGGAKRDPLRGLEARGQLAGDHRAEVAVVLEASRHVGEELGSEVGLQIGVGTEVIAARVRLVRWREARKDLRTSRCVSADLRGVPAVDPGREFPPLDLIFLVAIRGPDRHVERGRKPHLERAGCVHRSDDFVAPQLPREKRSLVRDSRIVRGAQDAVRPGRARDAKARSERHVEGVPQLVLEVVVPERGARIDRPARGPNPDPARDAVVPHVGIEFGQIAEGIDLGPVPIAVGIAPVTVTRALAETVPPVSVDLARAGAVQGQAQVAVGEHVLLEAVSPMIVWLGHGVPLDDNLPLAVDGIGEAVSAEVETICPRPIGRLAVQEFSEERERAGSDG